MNRTTWLVPIRYWEPADYQPIRVKLLHRSGKRHWYAFHEGYGHEVYIPRNRVFYSWFAARRVQYRLASSKMLRDKAEFAIFWQGIVSIFSSAP